MKTIDAAPAAGIIAAMAMMLLVPESAGAAVITRTYAIEAAGFAPLAGSTPAPVDPVHILATVTFDNAANIPDQTAGIALDSSNLGLGSALGFKYIAAADSLFIGGVQQTVGGTIGFSDDWAAIIHGASTDDPDFGILFYTVASVGAGWSTHEGTVTVAMAVPEPSALAMIPLGLLSLGAFARCHGAGRDRGRAAAGARRHDRRPRHLSR